VLWSCAKNKDKGRFMTEMNDAALSAALQAARDRLDRLEARLAAVESRSERLEALVARIVRRMNLDDNRQ
jgi:hypothetical protein